MFENPWYKQLYSNPSLRKEKRITLSFKTYLSVVSCVTTEFFYYTLQYIGQGESPEQVRPKVDEDQSSAAGSRQHQLLQRRRQEVSQLVAIWKLTFEKFSPSFHGWKIHLCLEAGRFAGRLFFFFFGFATTVLDILNTCIKSWTFLIPVKLLTLIICHAKDRWIEIGVKHCILVWVQNTSPSSLSKSILFLTVCVISVWSVTSFRPQFVVCLLLSLSPFYFLECKFFKAVSSL